MNYATNSGQKTASAQISLYPGALMGVDLTPPTTGYAILTVYDSEDSNTAGKLIISELYVDAGYSGINHEYFSPVVVNKGIYCTLVSSDPSTGSHYYIRYILG